MPVQKIDLTAIIRGRVKGIKGKFIPGFLLKALERFICQRDLNDILSTLYPKEGSEFASGVYDYLDLKLQVIGLDELPDGERYLFASNHPLGGLDGIGIIKVLGEKFGDENVRFVVNDMLMNVEPLKNVFLPVNKYGSQARSSAAALNEAFRSYMQLAIFPAGLVSRLQSDGSIKDLAWQKSFVVKALESGRKIVPVRFEAQNRRRFYKLAYWRKKLGIKVNLEQALLPGELVASRSKSFRLFFGQPVDPSKLREQGLSIPQIVAHLRTLSDHLS